MSGVSQRVEVALAGVVKALRPVLEEIMTPGFYGAPKVETEFSVQDGAIQNFRVKHERIFRLPGTK